MKRSVSRASKVSTDPPESLVNSIPGIPDDKWHEFLEKEETDLFILGLREEIISKCMETCYDNYLEKQAVAFTVHCAYLAWCKVLNVYYMFRDPGDTDDPKAKKSWEPDPEPEPSFIDSWGSECIVPVETKPQTLKPEKEPERVVCVTTSDYSSCSPELCSFASGLFNPEEEGYFDFPEFFSLSVRSEISKKKSLFSFSYTSHDSACMGKSATGVYCDECTVHSKTKMGDNTK